MVRNAARLIAMTTLVLAAGCGSDTTSTQPSPANEPSSGSVATTSSGTAAPADAPERYRRNLGRAFDSARDGRSPTMACTSVIAMAAGNPLPEATNPEADNVRAFELCYIDASARYIETLLAQITPAATVDAKNDLCARIASYAVISRTSLGSFAGNLRLDVGALDERLLQKVRSGMERHCPDQIEAISGYR